MADTAKQYRYSEIFGRTIQGEGAHTGKATSWIRFYGCNLECNGFGQLDPTNPATYQLPYQLIDLKDVTRMEDLPVFPYGCDSSYSWSKRYRHLAHMGTAKEIADRIREATKSEYNPDGMFKHPKSGQDIHMCFTGGEPIMSQHAVVDILQTQKAEKNLPNFVTIETNGTQELKEQLATFIKKNYAPAESRPADKTEEEWPEREWFWSVSPKLFTTSGEKNEKAIKPEVVAEYASVSDKGQLKFVVNGTDESWAEVEQVLAQFRAVGVNWPVWIMAVGATAEEQESIQAKVCEQAFDRGYNFSARVHCWVFGNVVGK